jgi:hypothetical protein
MNNAGQAAFVGHLAGGLHGPMVSQPDGTIANVITSQSGLSISRPIKINDSGRLAYVADDIFGGTSVWVHDQGGNAMLVAVAGSQAPGLESGVSFKTLSLPVLNDRGRAAFPAYLAGPGVAPNVNDFGIWTQRGGSLTKVVRLGDPAPEMVNAPFIYIDPAISFNRNGQLAFLALAGQVGFGLSETGIWATDQNGLLRLIVRTGQQIDVDDGAGVDLRTISDLSFDTPDLGGTGNGDGLGSAFNEWGQLVFGARFTDGSRGVFVSNLVRAPEPQSLLLAAVFFAIPAAIRKSAFGRWR